MGPGKGIGGIGGGGGACESRGVAAQEQDEGEWLRSLRPNHARFALTTEARLVPTEARPIAGRRLNIASDLCNANEFTDHSQTY